MFTSCAPASWRTAQPAHAPGRPPPAGRGSAACRRARSRPPLDRQAQDGAGAAGFLITAIPILMLGLGGVELAHWMSLRQALSLALMDAARVGATRQARPEAIALAFEQGLNMAHPGPEAADRVLRERRQALGLPWHIGIRQPAPTAFLDHADTELLAPRDTPGQALIRNDYQTLQHARRLAQGWPQGRGPRSGHTIYEANTLAMELLWPHRPLLPGLAALIRALAPLATDPAQASLMAAGFLPFRRQVVVTMQSDPAAWAPLPDGRITYETGSVDALTGPQQQARPAAPEPRTKADPPGRAAPGSAADGVPTTWADDGGQGGDTPATHRGDHAAHQDDPSAAKPSATDGPELQDEDPDGLMCAAVE